MRYFTPRSRILALLPAMLLLAGCTTQPGTAEKSGKLKVVATFSVIGDFVRNVAGDKVELTTLVGGDGDVHTFEPAPHDGVAVADADVIFENGIGLENWLDKLYSSTQAKAKRVVVSQGITLLHAEEGHGEHHHEDQDPHIWHDVANAIHMVEAIRAALVNLDPPNARMYEANAASYLQQLHDLDKWVQEQVATLPKSQRRLVTNHDTFGYFSRHYGFELVGTALSSFSTEASDPSAAEFAKLVDGIKTAKVPAIFGENVQNPKLMERLAHEAGVKLGPPLFTDSLGKEGSEGDTYIKMMRYNVTTIVTQLKQ